MWPFLPWLYFSKCIIISNITCFTGFKAPGILGVVGIKKYLGIYKNILQQFEQLEQNEQVNTIMHIPPLALSIEACFVLFSYIEIKDSLVA